MKKSRFNKKKGGLTPSKISSICNFRVARVQIEGANDAGKSWFMLSMIKHYVKTLGWPVKKIKFGFIDCDKEGIGPLLFGGVIPMKWMDRIEYIKMEKVLDVYGAYKAYEDIFEQHEDKTGFIPWYLIDNMGEFWSKCQQDYGEKVTGRPWHEILLDKQVEAKSRDKKTLPVFDQILDYRNINPLHNDFANLISRRKYNLMWSCLLTNRTFEEGGEKIERVVGAGQKDNEARIDFIFRRFRDKRTAKPYIDGHKLRAVSGKLIGVSPGDFTTMMNKWHKMLAIEMKKKKMPVPNVPWLTPYKEGETAQADRLGEAEAEAEEEIEAEEDGDEIEL